MLVVVLAMASAFVLCSAIMSVFAVRLKPMTSPVSQTAITWMDSTVLQMVQGEYSRNADLVKSSNAAGKRFDFVLYGDSITVFHAADPSVMQRYHPNAAALGVRGNTLEQLAWRIFQGQERLVPDPKIVAVHIGVNNLLQSKRDPSTRMREFLAALKKTYPTSRLVVMALLPTSRPEARSSIANVNQAYKGACADEGVTFAQCGSDLVPGSDAMPDGLHPSAYGQDRVHECLRKLIY